MNPGRSGNHDIPMLNLVRQQEQIGRELRDVLVDTLEDGMYFNSSAVTAFEGKLSERCRGFYAVGVGSGTAALHIGLLASGIGPGDEVVTVPNSFFATVEAVLQVGARPVFVDIDPGTHLMTADAVADSLTPRTKAILPVHLYGNVVDVAAIRSVLHERGRGDVVIIEDCAHAMGASRGGEPVPLGETGALSFNPTKNLGSLGDAGAIVTSDPDVAERARLLRDHGRADKNRHVSVGFNSRLSRINDGILTVKLKFLDEWNDRRRRIAQQYDDALGALPGFEPLTVESPVRHAYHQYVICTPHRDRLRRCLRERRIATGIHYPMLIPEQLPLQERGYTVEGMSVAVRVNRQIVSLPCYAELTQEEVDRVINEISDFHHALGRGHELTT